jgi:NAD(P)-dependent dehydrogenase (short-subunit alcohol dehydrogenase family)
MTVALVTGCSTGIGRAAALQLHRAGVTTVATARSLRTLDELADAGCTVLELDVTDDAGRRACVEEVTARHGGVDVLVNNAGYAEMGPVEQVPLDAWRRQLETNVLGPVALSQLVLPGMRAAGRGRIVNVSSMGGEITFPGGGAYHASKYALEALSDALRVEVRPFGVQVVVVQPGPVATSFGDNAADLGVYDRGPYGGLSRALARAIHEQTPRGSAPEAVARVVVRAATTRRPATRYRVGAMSRGLVLGRRVVPDRTWDALMRSQFRDPGPAVRTAA